MRPDRWMLLLHVLAALWLTSGIFAGAVARALTRRAALLSDKVFGLRLAWRLTIVFIIPGALLAGLLGIELARRSYGFAAFWVRASLLLYALMLALTLFYIRPRLARTLSAGVASLAAGSPTADFQALASAKLPGILADLNALGIVLLTLLMVLKP